MAKRSWQDDVRKVGKAARNGLKRICVEDASEIAHKLNIDFKTAKALKDLAWAAVEAGVEVEG